MSTNLEKAKRTASTDMKTPSMHTLDMLGPLAHSDEMEPGGKIERFVQVKLLRREHTFRSGLRHQTSEEGNFCHVVGKNTGLRFGKRINKT